MIIDIHNHTTPISSCSILRPVDLILRAKELGLDGVCITEHNEVWPRDQIDQLAKEHDFLVLRGMEVSTMAGHVLTFGFDRFPQGSWDIRNLKQSADAIGAVMIMSHPQRNVFSRVSPSDMVYFFDALEALNGRESDRHNENVIELCTQHGLKATGGSDAHALQEVGTCATEFDGLIRDEKDLIEALKSNSYRPIRLR